MKMGIKLKLYVYLFFLVVVCRVIFIIPNRKYLSILSIDEFYFTGAALVLLLFVIMLIFKLRKETILKIIIYFTIFVYTSLGIYYYSNLPKYTYEDAVNRVMKSIELDNQKAIVIMPEHREEKVGIKGGVQIFSTTNYLYYVYIKIGGDITVYRFDPMNGFYEETTVDRIQF